MGSLSDMSSGSLGPPVSEAQFDAYTAARQKMFARLHNYQSLNDDDDTVHFLGSSYSHSELNSLFLQGINLACHKNNTSVTSDLAEFVQSFEWEKVLFFLALQNQVSRQQQFPNNNVASS